jgi:DNA-directed RNA polymerase subunit H
VKKNKFEITDHVLVPKHEKLSQAKTKDLLTRYNINTQQLPRINIKDPVLKDLDVKAGDVIKISRDSPTLGKSVYYRVVVLE